MKNYFNQRNKSPQYPARIKRVNKKVLVQTLQQNIKSDMNHVTFENFNRNNQQKILPTNKPKYNFTYGEYLAQQNTQKKNRLTQKSYVKINQLPQKSHIQIIQEKSQQQKIPQVPYSFDRNLNQKSFSQLGQIKNSSPYKTSTWNEKRNSSKKKKLKIFPQKYQLKNEKQQPKIQKEDKQNEQISKLKTEIQKLRQQIKLQNSSKIYEFKQSSKVSSANKQIKDLNFSAISKIQEQRTKRLSQLQNFNQMLYNELAWKLKQVSNVEYQMYQQQSRLNKMFMESILDHSSANKNTNYLNINQLSAQNNNSEFIDIKQFEKQYQKKFNENNRFKSLNQSPKTIDFTNQTEKQKFYGQIFSPFSLKQNNIQQYETVKDQFGYITNKQTNFQSTKNEGFTFNKPTKYSLTQVQGFNSTNENKEVQVDNKYDQERRFSVDIARQLRQCQRNKKENFKDFNQDLKFSNQFQQTTQNHNAYGAIDLTLRKEQKQNPVLKIGKNIRQKQKQTKQLKQIKYFNSQLQAKILRKRIRSSYAVVNNNGMKIYKLN